MRSKVNEFNTLCECGVRFLLLVLVRRRPYSLPLVRKFPALEAEQIQTPEI